MDKDMIKIDDLFKDRLNDNEEKERPGAWLLMKDILNEKMPVAVGVGAALYNWRKIYSFFAGAAVIGSVIVGYKALHKNDGTHKTVAVNTTVATNVSVNPTNATTVNSSDNKKQKETSTVTAITTNTNKNKVASSTIAGVPAVKVLNNAAHVKAASVNNTKQISNTTNNNLNVPEPNTNKSSGLLASGKSLNKPSEPKSKQDQAQQPSADNNQTNANKSNNEVNNNLIPPATIASEKQKVSNNQPDLPRIQDQRRSNPRYIDRDAKMDSAELIVVKESVRKGKVNVTTTRGMIARAKNSLPETEENFYSHPAEQATSSSVDEMALVNMKSNKVESKYYKSRGSSNFFEEMVKNVSVDISGISFHGGLMGGINSSLGTYHMAGFQVGLAGMMDLNDRWMVFAELKYLQRFGSGKSLSNNYNQLGTPQYLGNSTFNYKWESVEHYFNISSSALVELPIAVRYSSKRISMFTGLNTAYNFAVNVEEKENRTPQDFITTGSSSQLTSTWNKDQPVITTNDFGSRITMGAMLGFGYQVSPAVGFDLRVTQPFWDNVKSKGAYQVSKELYRVPSLQFNLTYRFSNNNYKMR